MNINSIQKMIVNNIGELIQTNTFTDWFGSQQFNNGDLVVINNSFIYRKPLIKTTKNRQYIGMKTNNKVLDMSSISIVTPNDFDTDFKNKIKDRAYPIFEPLSQALTTEITQIGHLVFFLIGELIEVPINVEIYNPIVHELIYDPQAINQQIVEKNGTKVFVVNQINDPEFAWNSDIGVIEKLLGNNISSFEKEFVIAFKKLQDDVRLKMILPDSNAIKTNNTFITMLHDSIVQHISHYKHSLDLCISGNDENNINLRDIMRISYNFADDAIKLLQLLVSIADLKPVIFWMTIPEHYYLAEAFRNLPWTKSEKKPSIERYAEIVKNARNRAFHNLLIFDRTIEASLDGIRVNAKN
jgi:hypothetical protein